MFINFLQQYPLNVHTRHNCGVIFRELEEKIRFKENNKHSTKIISCKGVDANYPQRVKIYEILSYITFPHRYFQGFIRLRFDEFFHLILPSSQKAHREGTYCFASIFYSLFLCLHLLKKSMHACKIIFLLMQYF